MASPQCGQSAGQALADESTVAEVGGERSSEHGDRRIEPYSVCFRADGGAIWMATPAYSFEMCQKVNKHL